MNHYQAIVIGAGPAGTALVSALCRQDLDVAWCAADLHQPWPNNYGLWVDELPAGLDPDLLVRAWSQPIVRIGEKVRQLNRAYGRVDGDKMRRALLANIDPTEFTENVRDVVDGKEVLLESGTKLTGQLVFDATGVGRFLNDSVENVEGAESVAAQTAYGVLATVRGDPIDGAPMSLMDFDSSFRADDGPASFLYAMELEGAWFLEETVLVGRPPYPVDDLRTLLDQRMAYRGVSIEDRIEEERCFIPMGTPLPSLDQPVVGFGASAGFVHPASGYSLARSLSAANVAAEAAQSGSSREVWRAIWPAERVRSRQLYQFGMETLLSMDRAATERFFDAFFELPDHAWQGYLSDTLSPRGVQGVMLRVFAEAPMSIRLKLMRAALGPNSMTLVRGIFG